MFDLSKIDFIDDSNRENNFSFVGLKKEDETTKFYLPKGFNEFEKDSFNEVKKLFLDLYKIFRKYQKNAISNRDGSLNNKGGFEFKTEEDETILLYSKINMFDTILDEFDDMDIYSFHIKRTNSDYIDYSKIDKYIDRAIFLEDNIIYLDEVEINKDVLEFYEAELVEMFCYIYLDIKKVLLEEEDIPSNIISLALNFREKHLTYESSLFEEDSFEITKETLKERLEIIDKKSLLKDAVYDKFYDAIYTFLYGNPFFEGTDDVYWGINNFSFVWEDMAQSYCFYNWKDEIIFADTDRFEKVKVGEKKCYKKDDFEYPFILNYGGEKKYIYPDLVFFQDSIKHYSSNKYPKTDEKMTGANDNNNGYYDRTKNIIEIENYTIIDWYWNDYPTDYYYYTIYKDDIKISKRYKKDNFAKDKNRITKENYKTGIEEILKTIIEENKDEENKELKNMLKIIMEKSKIIDFKYMSIKALKENEDKVQTDIKKQLLYKLALESQYPQEKVKNIFYIPSSSKETDVIEIESLQSSDIEVRYLNFNDAIKSYLEYKNDK